MDSFVFINSLTPNMRGQQPLSIPSQIPMGLKSMQREPNRSRILDEEKELELKTHLNLMNHQKAQRNSYQITYFRLLICFLFGPLPFFTPE